MAIGGLYCLRILRFSRNYVQAHVGLHMAESKTTQGTLYSSEERKPTGEEATADETDKGAFWILCAE